MLSAEVGYSLRVVNSEIRTILPHIIRKNSIIVLSFIQYFSKFLTSYTFFETLVSFSTPFQDTDRRLFACRYSLQKQITSIYQYVLRILEFLPFNFSQKFSYFV